MLWFIIFVAPRCIECQRFEIQTYFKSFTVTHNFHIHDDPNLLPQSLTLFPTGWLVTPWSRARQLQVTFFVPNLLLDLHFNTCAIPNSRQLGADSDLISRPLSEFIHKSSIPQVSLFPFIYLFLFHAHNVVPCAVSCFMTTQSYWGQIFLCSMEYKKWVSLCSCCGCRAKVELSLCDQVFGRRARK